MLYEVYVYCLEEDAFDVRRAITEIMSHSVIQEGYAHLKINSPTWKIFNLTKKIPVGIPFIAIYVDHTDLRSKEDLTKKGKTLIIQREQMEAYAQDVINKYELGKKGLDIEEQKLVKDVILGMLEIASKGAGAALGAKVSKTGFQ